jgi:uncharacterized membrane protein YgcG
MKRCGGSLGAHRLLPNALWLSRRARPAAPRRRRPPDDVKDLDFARVPSGGSERWPLLATTYEDGQCWLWDVAAGAEVCQLRPPKGEGRPGKPFGLGVLQRSVLQVLLRLVLLMVVMLLPPRAARCGQGAGCGPLHGPTQAAPRLRAVAAPSLLAGLEKGRFTRCRFARAAPILYVVLNLPRGGACHVAAYGPPLDPQRRGSGSGAPQLQRQSSGGGGAPGEWVLLKRYEVDSGPNSALEISPGGTLLALGQTEGGLLVSVSCRAPGTRCAAVLRQRASPPPPVPPSLPAPLQPPLSPFTRTRQVVDARTLHVVRREPRVSMVFVTRVAFSDDGGRVLAAGGDANVFVLDMREGGGGGGCGGAGGRKGAAHGDLVTSVPLSLLAALGFCLAWLRCDGDVGRHGRSKCLRLQLSAPPAVKPCPSLRRRPHRRGGGFCLVLLLLLLAAVAGVAFVLHTQPDAAARAAEVWEALQRDERVRGGVSAVQARVQELVGRFTDEL